MKGKNKKKRALKISLIAMSFILVMVLGVSLTLAWFYDGDWASNYVQMGGPVGIKIYDTVDGEGKPNHFTSGANNLHFNLLSSEKAYPGQSIKIQAGIYNEGMQSTVLKKDGDNLSFETQTSGSSCFVRAHFAVYTSITDTTGTFDVSDLCTFVDGLIGTQNQKYKDGTDYYWFYHQEKGSKALSETSTDASKNKHYFNGKEVTENTDILDDGYYYLCGGSNEDIPTGDGAEDKAILKELEFLTAKAYLWDSTIVIPWQLNNGSADAVIVVEVRFEAIQTFIPEISGGVISNAENNRVDDDEVTDDYQVSVGNDSLQTVFNSSDFSSTFTQANGNEYTGKIKVTVDGTDFLIPYVDTESKDPYVPFLKATKAKGNVDSFTQKPSPGITKVTA